MLKLFKINWLIAGPSPTGAKCRPTATLLLVAALLDSTALLHAGEAMEPRQMLERLTAAMSQMNYQGTFVYVQGGDVETMRITHVSDADGVRERLVALSGPPREVLRDSSGVRWVLADDQSVFEDAAFNRSFFPELPLDQYDRIEASYTLKLGPKARIAGHKAQNLKVVPRDAYRYGYSLWLEDHSGLLLKWELIDSNRKPIAKLMFTDVRLGSEVDVKELISTSQLKKFKTVESKLPSGKRLSKAEPRWEPSSLPGGFELTAHRFSGKEGEASYEHLVYSDGLAAVSVYVENPVPESGARAGINRRGTTHAFSRTSDDMRVTVVGDVPAITVKFIAEAVEDVSH
jgi:sigma-E factor negative regulatory protein RseB